MPGQLKTKLKNLKMNTIMKKISVLLALTVVTFSCVSKKKYVALQQENGEITSELQKTRVAKEDLEAKFLFFLNLTSLLIERAKCALGADDIIGIMF